MSLQQKQDAAGESVGHAYSPNGSLAARTWARGVTATYTHNVLGELAGITYSNGTPEVAIARDEQGRLASDEAGEAWHYDYNSRGEVKKGEKKLGTSAVPGMKRGYQYDAIGNRTEARVNGLDNNWRPNALNQIDRRNVEGKQFLTGKAALPPALLTVAAQADSALSAPVVTVTRGPGSYFGATIDTKNDEVAKQVKITVTEQVSGGAASEQVGHLFVPASPEVFSYDLDGNLTRDGRWEYTWDAENRLSTMQARAGLVTAGPDPLPIERLTFRYDAFGRRVSKVLERKTGGNWGYVGFTRFAYDGWNLIAEWDYDFALVRESLARTHHWGLDLSGTLQGAGGVGGLVLTRHHGPTGATTSAYPAYDGNGNIVALFDTASGKRAADYEYGPFGEPLRATGAMAQANPFRFSTKYTDEESGLCYYGYRYYQPAAGKWLSRDPLGERLKEPNLGSFVNNSPNRYIDVFGLFLTTADLNEISDIPGANLGDISNGYFGENEPRSTNDTSFWNYHLGQLLKLKDKYPNLDMASSIKNAKEQIKKGCCLEKERVSPVPAYFNSHSGNLKDCIIAKLLTDDSLLTKFGKETIEEVAGELAKHAVGAGIGAAVGQLLPKIPSIGRIIPHPLTRIGLTVIGMGAGIGSTSAIEALSDKGAKAQNDCLTFQCPTSRDVLDNYNKNKP